MHQRPSALAFGITRRTFAHWLRAGALVGGLLAAAHASAAEDVKVRLDFLPYGLHAPFYYAVDKGWFAEKGLNVQIDDGNGTGPALALIAGNKYDIAQVSLGALPVARDKGMPVKAIAGITRKGDFGVIVAEDGDIKKPKDLEGKTIIYSANSVETPFIDIYLKRAGVDKSKVNMTNVDIAAKIPTYMSGKGDGMLSSVPLYTIKGVTPRASRGLLFADEGVSLPGFGLVASEDTIAKRPKVLADFVAVFQRSWMAVRSGGAIDEAVESLLKARPNAKLDPKVMKAQLEAMFPYIDTAATKGKPMLWMAPEDWTSAIKVMEELGLVKSGTNAAGEFTNQFIPGTP